MYFFYPRIIKPFSNHSSWIQPVLSPQPHLHPQGLSGMSPEKISQAASNWVAADIQMKTEHLSQNLPI